MTDEAKHNLEVTRRIAAEQRERREAHERKMREIGSPYDGTNKLITKFRNGEKLKPKDIARELAITKLVHTEADGSTPEWVPIRVELLEIAGRKIAGPVAWAKAQSDVQRGKKRKAGLHKVWRAEADTIWRKTPSLTATRVAKLVARKTGGNPNWIRRKIQKPR